MTSESAPPLYYLKQSSNRGHSRPFTRGKMLRYLRVITRPLLYYIRSFIHLATHCHSDFLATLHIWYTPIPHVSSSYQRLRLNCSSCEYLQQGTLISVTM